VRYKVFLIQIIVTFFIWFSLNGLYENFINFADELYKFVYYMLIVLIVIYFNVKLRVHFLKGKQ